MNSVRMQAEVEFVRDVCEGGNGRVVLVQHACLAGQVAVKVVSSRVIDDVRAALERLLDLEATVTTVIGDHAHIVQVCSCTAARRPCCAHSDQHCAELSLCVFDMERQHTLKGRCASVSCICVRQPPATGLAVAHFRHLCPPPCRQG